MLKQSDIPHKYVTNAKKEENCDNRFPVFTRSLLISYFESQI